MNDIITKLLKIYGIAQVIDLKKLRNTRLIKSNIYGMGTIYSFDYEDNHYYALNDHSLMDNPEYIRKVIEEINPKLTGGPLKNPIPQSDGAIYACGIDGVEYYLWQTEK